MHQALTFKVPTSWGYTTSAILPDKTSHPTKSPTSCPSLLHNTTHTPLFNWSALPHHCEDILILLTYRAKFTCTPIHHTPFFIPRKLGIDSGNLKKSLTSTSSSLMNSIHEPTHTYRVQEQKNDVWIHGRSWVAICHMSALYPLINCYTRVQRAWVLSHRPTRLCFATIRIWILEQFLRFFSPSFASLKLWDALTVQRISNDVHIRSWQHLDYLYCWRMLGKKACDIHVIFTARSSNAFIGLQRWSSSHPQSSENCNPSSPLSWWSH